MASVNLLKVLDFLAPVTSQAELLLTVKDDPGVKSRRLGADPIIPLRTRTLIKLV